MRYLRNKKLGFDKEHVLVIDGTESILRNRSGFLKVAANLIDVFKMSQTDRQFPVNKLAQRNSQ